MTRWRWQNKETKEAMGVFRVDHYLTRDDIADLLCLSLLETGTSLSQAALVHHVQEGLRAAPIMEPIEFWGESYTEEEATARREWAWDQAHKFYEATR